MSKRASLTQMVVRNWPIKLAAGFFAVMLYIAVAAQQPLSQSFAMRLAVTVPPGRTVRQQPAGVTVVLSGKGSEILKLRSFPRAIRKTIPDTFSTSSWRAELGPADIELPKGIDVQVADIRPRDIEVVLDSVTHRDVRIVPRVKVEAESGYVVRGLSITPSLARLIGPEKSLAGIESVTTLPTVISSVNGPFFQTVPIDTAPLGIVRITPKAVRMDGARSGGAGERAHARQRPRRGASRVRARRAADRPARPRPGRAVAGDLRDVGRRAPARPAARGGRRPRPGPGGRAGPARPGLGV